MTQDRARIADQKPSMETAHIDENIWCADCGWPVIDACCNFEFRNYATAAREDWWYYCTNKGCKNHAGEGAGGVFDAPSWIAHKSKAAG